MTEPDNMLLVLLREIRAEQHAMRNDMNARFAEMDRRLDAMHANGLRALQQFIGFRNMTVRSMAGIEQDLAVLKERVDRLEAAHL